MLLAGAAIFLATAVCGYGAAAPAAQPTVDSDVPSGGGPVPTAASAATSSPGIVLPTPTEQGAFAPEESAPAAAIPEYRRLTLEYPPKIRLGDSDLIRLTLEVDALGNLTPTAQIQGHNVTGQTVSIPNLYDTQNVIAEASLDLAGVDIRPTEQVSEPLLPGQSVTFFWSVHPPSAGTYRGTVWLFLRFVDKATKEETRQPISAQTVEISTSNFLGLSGGMARITGSIGAVLGAVLGFPFVDDVLKWLWKRITRGA
ncbi:MAG TPA: hypothetical protein VMJ64_04820 [Anaerolineales bacterium]|nr:hypothetical protein [Anaerolineales bacterium]